MKKYTKIVALFLAVLMVLSLSACGKKLSVGESLQMGNDGDNGIWWEVIAVDSDRALMSNMRTLLGRQALSATG